MWRFNILNITPLLWRMNYELDVKVEIRASKEKLLEGREEVEK